MSTAPPPETIGERLRRLRLERGLSQRELAVTGVSYAYISRIEAGTRQPSVKALRKLGARLRVSAEYLETGSDFTDQERRELSLADAELQLRLGERADDVEPKLRALAAEAMTAGDLPVAERARIGIAFAATRAGRHDEAARELESVIRDFTPAVAERPDVYTTLGRTYALLGEPERAVELFDECIARLEDEAPDDAVARARFATYLSYALSDIGALEKAEEAVGEALSVAADVADPITQVRLYWSMARLASMQERPTAALRYARRALALYEVTEDSLGLARAHILCASMLSLKGSLDRAVQHLDSAERLLGANADRPDLAYLRSEQARVAALRGDSAIAVAYARESLELLDDNDPGEQGLAHAVLGEGLAAGGDAEGARRELQRGFELLVEHGRWRDARHAAEVLVQALRSLGRNAEAEDVLERAGALGNPVAVDA